MKSHVFAPSLLGAVIALALALPGCGTGAPCPGVNSVDDELASNCGIPAAPDAGPAGGCTPRPGTICTVVGTGNAGLGTDNVQGTRSAAYLPIDVTVGPDGQTYFIDWNNHVIRQLRHDGTVHTVIGSGELSDGVDPPDVPGPHPPVPALMARLNHPTQVTFDTQGHMYIAAWHNSKVKLVDTTNPNPALWLVRDVCGSGARSFAGDGMPVTVTTNGTTSLNTMVALNLPVSVAIHPGTNDIYISDQANWRVRAVNGMGIINTVAGTGMRGYTGDGGPALMAQLNSPIGQAAAPAGRIAFDAAGNLYIADTGNNAIRRVDSQGIITTIAGTGMAGYGGDGGPARMAQLNGPVDVDVGADGTVYIADTQNSCVRAINAGGVIRTVAGRCGMRGFAGDGASPTAALLDRPYGVGPGTGGRLYIADTYNQRVRVVMTQ